MTLVFLALGASTHDIFSAFMRRVAFAPKTRIILVLGSTNLRSRMILVQGSNATLAYKLETCCALMILAPGMDHPILHGRRIILHVVLGSSSFHINGTLVKVAHNSLVRIRHACFRCSIAAIPIIFRKSFSTDLYKFYQ